MFHLARIAFLIFAPRLHRHQAVFDPLLEPGQDAFVFSFRSQLRHRMKVLSSPSSDGQSVTSIPSRIACQSCASNSRSNFFSFDFVVPRMYRSSACFRNATSYFRIGGHSRAEIYGQFNS